MCPNSYESEDDEDEITGCGCEDPCVSSFSSELDLCEGTEDEYEEMFDDKKEVAFISKEKTGVSGDEDE